MSGKKLISVTLSILFLIVTITGCSMQGRKAKQRVTSVMKGMQQRGNSDHVVGDEETAVCQFFRDAVRIPDSGQLFHASQEYDKWRNEANLPAMIKEFTVDEKVDMEGDITIVYGTMDGLEFSIRVPKDGQMIWVDIPDY
ncbi:MAG: hypothetical protein GY940_06185 [bacterium]|nr:hypothetical protein [bacterium]